MERKQLNVRVDASLHHELMGRAAKPGQTVTGIVTAALENWLDGAPGGFDAAEAIAEHERRIARLEALAADAGAI